MGRRGEGPPLGAHLLARNEQLAALLQEKVGLDEAKASQVVEVVVGFLKDNPERLRELLGAEPVGAARGGLGRLFGR